jgi:HK97 family phage major capsid protein
VRNDFNSNKVVSLSSAAHEFVQVAKCLAAGRGRADEVQRWARSVPSSRVRDVLKSGVTPHSLSTDGTELAPYRELSTGFFGSMAANSAFSKIYNAGDFTRTPLRTLIGVLTTAPVAYSVSELAPKPVASMDFATATLEPEKVSALIVITEELARSLSPAATIRLGEELRRAASVAVDAKFLALVAATSGITSAGSSGVTAANVFADLTTRLNAMDLGADSRLWLIVGPKLYKTLSLVQGTGGYILQNGAIGAIKVAVSDAASTVATLIDAKAVAAELDSVTLDSTRNASLQMSDTPSSGEPATVSLWQQNMTGLKCEISFGAAVMRSTSATLLTGYSA